MNYYERYCGDYAADTRDLSLVEHGVYTLLLDTYYSTERALPADPVRLYRICSAITEDEQAAVRLVADKFFPINGDGKRHNKRADELIPDAQKRIATSRENGKKGGRPPKKEPKKNPKAKPEPSEQEPGGLAADNPSAKNTSTNTNPNSNTNPKTSTDKNQGAIAPLSGDAPFGSVALSGDTPDLAGQKPDSKTARRENLQATARGILDFLNERAAKRFPHSDSNVGIVVARLKEGFTEAQIRQVIANRIRKWKTDPKMAEYLRPETLFGPRKFSSYVGELVEIPDEPWGEA